MAPVWQRGSLAGIAVALATVLARHVCADPAADLCASISDAQEIAVGAELLRDLRALAPDADETIGAMWWMYEWYHYEGMTQERDALLVELKAIPDDRRHWGSYAAEFAFGHRTRVEAEAAEAAGDLERALTLWRRLKPFGFCGNGRDAIVSERNWHVAKCLLDLGREDGALDALDDAIVSQEMYCEIETAATWVWLQQQRVGTARLRRMVSDYPGDHVPAGISLARRYIEMIDTGVRGDAASLWAELTRRPLELISSDWRPRLALRLLAMAPRESTWLAHEKLRDPEITQRAWALVVLARTAPPDALSLVSSTILPSESARQNTYVMRHAILATCLLGADFPHAQALLEGIVANGADTPLYNDAQAVLERFPTTEAAREFLDFAAELPDLTGWEVEPQEP
jgi:hypothetical protein